MALVMAMMAADSIMKAICSKQVLTALVLELVKLLVPTPTKIVINAIVIKTAPIRHL
jgi:hypothetical protein